MTDTFNPDWRSPPGDTVLDWMEEHAISKEKFAQETLLSVSDVEQLLSGELLIDFDIACRLATEIGGTPNFWLERERRYREPKT